MVIPGGPPLENSVDCIDIQFEQALGIVSIFANSRTHDFIAQHRLRDLVDLHISRACSRKVD